jgi:hypothetical protein
MKVQTMNPHPNDVQVARAIRRYLFDDTTSRQRTRWLGRLCVIAAGILAGLTFSLVNNEVIHPFVGIGLGIGAGLLCGTALVFFVADSQFNVLAYAVDPLKLDEITNSDSAQTGKYP